MFGKLFDFLQGYWEWIKYNVGEFFSRVLRIFETAWSVFVILAFVIAWAFETIKHTIVTLVSQAAAIILPNPNGGGGSAISWYLGVANTVFPLDETLAFIVGYVMLYITLETYAAIKRWMPKPYGIGQQ